MADPQKNQTPEVPTQELPETTLGIKKIREDIVALKLEANALEDKRKDFEKNKKTLPKEESDKIKQEIDAKAKYIEEQKEKLSALLKQTKGELAILKGSVETSVAENELDALEKEIKEIKGEEKNVFEKGRSRVQENPWKTVAIATGVGVVVGWMAGRFKKKKKKGFRNHGIGRVLKYAGIGIAAFFGIKRLYDQFKGETMKPGEDQADDFDKLTAAEKEKYTTFGDKVNIMYNSMCQKEIDDGLSNDAALGKGYNSTDAKKYEGVVPFSMDKTYSTVHDMLGEGAINRHIWKKNAEEYKEIVSGRAKDKLESLLGPTLMKIQSFSVLGYKPGANLAETIQQRLIANPDEACAALDIFFRQFIMVLTYLEEKRVQLRRQLTINALNAVGFNGKKLTGLDEEEQNDLIEDAMDNKEWMETNVNKVLASEFDNKKINSIGEVLTKYNIYDEKISEDLTEDIKELDEKRDDLLDYDEDSKTDILDRAETDIADGTLESGTKSDLSDCADDVLKDAISEDGDGFMQTYFTPIAIACGMDQAARAKYLEESGGKELLNNFALGLQKYKEKFTTGTATKEDIENFKTIVTRYMAFKKEVIIAVHTIQNIGEDNPDRISRAINALWSPFKGLYQCFTEKMPRLEWTGKFCRGLMAVGGVLYITGWLTGKKIILLTGKNMFKVGGLVPYLGFKAGMATLKYAGGKTFMSGRYREKKIWDSSDPQQLFRRAVMSGEITPKRAMKMVRNPKLGLKNIAGGNIQNVQELLIKFGAKDTEQADLILKYLDNPKTKKLILQKNKLVTYGKEDWLKLNVWERSLRFEYEFAQDNLVKMKNIDAVIQANKSRNSGKVLESLLANVDEKEFTKLHGLIQSSSASWTSEIDQLFTKMGSKLDAKKFGKLLGKNLNEFTSIADLQKLFHTIETGNLDAKSISVIVRKRRDVGARLAKGEKLEDVVKQVSKNFVKKIISAAPEVVKNLSVEQKAIVALLDKDISDFTKFIEKDIKNMPQYGPNSSMKIHYDTKLKKLEAFKLEIKTFTTEEVDAFNALRKLEFKSQHIIELLDLKKSNKAVENALENVMKQGDLSELVDVLKREKITATISDPLIDAVEHIHTKNLLKSTDEVVEFITRIFKFLSKAKGVV